MNRKGIKNKIVTKIMLIGGSKFKVVQLNNDPKISSDFEYDSAVYTVTHYNTSDMPITLNVISGHSCLLLGKQELEDIDRYMFKKNGYIEVDRDSKESKKKSKKKCVEKIKDDNQNIIIYSEATWNRSENKILAEQYWGMIDIAYESKVPLIPLVLDYDYENKICYTKFCEPVLVNRGFLNKKMKKKIMSEIEEKMATAKWDIWRLKANAKDEEIVYQVERKSIEYDYYDKQLESDLKSYPKLNWEKEQTYLKKSNIPFEDVFEPINKIKQKEECLYRVEKGRLVALKKELETIEIEEQKKGKVR